MGSILKALVAVELQLCSDPLFFSSHSKMDRIQNKVYRLFCARFICDNTVVIQIADHGQIKDTLFCVYVGDVCYPFVVWPVSLKLSVEQVLIAVYMLPHVGPSPAAADLRQQIILFHYSQYSFGVMIDPS